MAEDGERLLRAIFSRIKEIERKRFDADLAEVLHASKERIGQWKVRGTIPWEQLLDYCREQHVSLEYLVNGIGPPRRTDLVSEPGAVYKVETNQDALYQISADIYRALREVGGEVTPEKFARLVRLAHREMLDKNETTVPYAKILEMVKLAV